jgi:hypothetical protein
MIFTEIGYVCSALFALSFASLAVLAWLAWRADRRDPLAAVIAPPVPEVIDDALPMFFERRTQAAPWPDGDTVIDGGMRAELNEMLKGDGRG